LIVFGVPLIALGMESAVAILFNQKQENTEKRQIASIGLALVLISSFLALLLFTLGADQLYALLLDRSGYKEVLWLAILTCVLAVPTQYVRNLLRWQFRRKLFAILLVTEACLVFIAGSIAVVGFGMGVVGWMSAIIAASLITLLLALLANKKSWQWPDMQQSIPLLKLGIPFALVSLSATLLPIATRTVLVHLAGLAEVGVFGVAERVAAIVGLLITGFTAAWGPFYLSRQNDPNVGQLYGRVARYYLMIACWIGLAIILFGKWIVALMAPTAYAGAQDLLLPLVILKLMLGLDYIAMAGIYIRQKPYHLIWISLLGGTCAILLSLLLVPRYGNMGAAYAALLAKVIALTFTLVVSQRLFPIQYGWNQLGRLFLSILITAGLSLTIPKSIHLWSHLAGSLIALASFPVLCVALGVVDRNMLWTQLMRNIKKEEQISWKTIK